MENLLDILGLYKDHYPLWRNKSLREIYLHIYPSLLFGQCRLHRDDDGIAYGFRNWAFLDEEAEKKFLETGQIDTDKWKSGDKLWIVDSIFTKRHKEHMIFYKTFFTHLLGVGKPVQWLRVSPDNKIRTHIKLTTRERDL
jgi:hemolysin-activating ACP:hemolysin acyltransferase|tara:strand:- start:5 stop:424 length:420 start_codon:yes stop_codon:yes gene_type:complete